MSDVVVHDLIIADAGHPWVLVEVRTNVGLVEILGRVERTGRVVHLRGAHIHGLRPGALNRQGLNAIGRAALEVLDVETLVVEGFRRSTGARPGHVPRPFTCQRRP